MRKMCHLSRSSSQRQERVSALTDTREMVQSTATTTMMGRNDMQTDIGQHTKPDRSWPPLSLAQQNPIFDMSIEERKRQRIQVNSN